MYPALKIGEMGKDVTKTLSGPGKEEEEEEKKKIVHEVLLCRGACWLLRWQSWGSASWPKATKDDLTGPLVVGKMQSDYEQRQLVEQGREEHGEAVKCC